MDKIFNWEQWRIIAVSTVSLLFGYLTPNKRFCLCVGSNVCVQYLGRNEGEQRGDCAMQKLFVPEV